jgi:hypothetical protein
MALPMTPSLFPSLRKAIFPRINIAFPSLSQILPIGWLHSRASHLLMLFTLSRGRRRGMLFISYTEFYTKRLLMHTRPVEEDNWRFRTVPMYDTDPHVQFSPRSSSPPRSWWDWFCSSRDIFWTAERFLRFDGSISSYHLLHAKGDTTPAWLAATAIFKGARVLSC